jgi:hypothetical protein
MAAGVEDLKAGYGCGLQICNSESYRIVRLACEGEIGLRMLARGEGQDGRGRSVSGSGVVDGRISEGLCTRLD